MCIKFRKDRFSSFGEKHETQHEIVVLRKTRLKFFSIKNRKKIVLTANQRCRHYTESFLLRFFNRFFEVHKVGPLFFYHFLTFRLETMVIDCEDLKICLRMAEDAQHCD